MELDTAYYGIPRKTSVEKWVEEVPESFRFVVKVYQGISGQSDWQEYYQTHAKVRWLVAPNADSMRSIHWH